MWKLYLLVLVALSEKMLAQTSKVVAQFDTTPLEYLDMSDLAYTEQDWDEKPGVLRENCHFWPVDH